ncbi:MAG: DJ-1/PfpI family protein [Oscillatoriales cyanobacterium C42_A2020_001]|nr:DJ-1/PfpI family protein [Leptolyngbyaceae cyanobacterium C42_A2020_001]
MKVAFVVYTPMTVLDFVGVYDPLTRLQSMGFIPDLTWEICAIAESVGDSHGLGIVPTQINQPLDSFDLLIVPGGITPLVYELTKNAQLLEWLQTARNCKLKVSVCTGSLLLGAAGFLNGKKATTHPNAYDLLQDFCEVVTDQRVVDAGDVITARGVTASIDLGLYLCEKFVGVDATKKIRAMMDYPYVVTIGRNSNDSR